jgi:hypothetical protein
VTGHSGIVTGDSGRSRNSVTFERNERSRSGRNGRSRSNGISGQKGPEYARAFAEEFTDVTEICFQVEWKGLKSRVIAATPNSNRYYSDTYIAHSDGSTVIECMQLAEIIGDLPGVVARLFAPVYRMFDARADISAEYVSRWLPAFIVRGM